MCHNLYIYHEYCTHTRQIHASPCRMAGTKGCLELKGTENEKSYCGGCWKIQEGDEWVVKERKIQQLLRALERGWRSREGSSVGSRGSSFEGGG